MEESADLETADGVRSRARDGPVSSTRPRTRRSTSPTAEQINDYVTADAPSVEKTEEVSPEQIDLEGAVGQDVSEASMTLVGKEASKISEPEGQNDKLKSPSHYATSPLPKSEAHSQLFTPSDIRKKDEVTRRYLQISTCIAVGVVFGIAGEKSRVFEPFTLRRQMVFKQWIVLKYFFGALCGSQLGLAILSLLPWTKHHFRETQFNYLCSLKGKGIVSSILGSLILGIGMTVGGSCPGIVLVQISAGTQNSGYAFLGILIGTLVYGFVEPLVVRWTAPKTPFSVEPTLIHEKLKVHYAALAIPMMICMTVGITLIEYFIPWTADLELQDKNPEGVSFVSATSWPPSAAGAMMGLLQIPLVLAVSNTVGGSSGYVTIMSQWVFTKKLQERFKYFANARTGFLENWWMVVYNGGIVIGSLLSSLSSVSNGSTSGVPPLEAIIGGFLLLFGARFASGCTSGHGISGVSMLGFLSFISVCFLFGGGIAAGYVMQYFDVLKI